MFKVLQQESRDISPVASNWGLFLLYFVFLVCKNQHLIKGNDFGEEGEGRGEQFCQILPVGRERQIMANEG